VVGAIVGEKADEIAQLAEDYARQQRELAETSIEGRERLLNKKVNQLQQKLDEVLVLLLVYYDHLSILSSCR